MTSGEAQQILTELEKRQTLDLFDRQAILEVIAPHGMQAVIRAITDIRKREPYVGAHNLAVALGQVRTEPARAELPLVTAAPRELTDEQREQNLRRLREITRSTFRVIPGEAS